MRILITTLIVILNALFALSGLYNHIPRLVSLLGFETAVAFIVAVVPFAATALFAFGMRSKPVWTVAALLNLLTLLGMIGLIVFTETTQSGPAAGAFVGGFAVAGVMTAANLAFLLWHIPSSEGTKANDPR
jgi:hypothetical protein